MSDPQQNKKMSIPGQPSSSPEVSDPQQNKKMSTPGQPSSSPQAPPQLSPQGPPPPYTPTIPGYPQQPSNPQQPGQQYQYQQRPPVVVRGFGAPMIGFGGFGQFGLGNYPSQLTCPHCHHGVVTQVVTTPSDPAWVACIIMFLLGWWCCCFIPFCIPECQRSVHTCPNCHRVIGYGGGDIII